MGAGLLAKALDQSTLVQADTPPSRASPLPQGDLCRTQNLCTTTFNCGSGLARESAGSVNTCAS
ncbi:hypothetical protein C1X65_26110 [Pseudomonas sp. FW305-70]|nr:hypothetical protein C1X65_26110 [Pseudomonas sp. FW305-70]